MGKTPTKSYPKSQKSTCVSDASDGVSKPSWSKLTGGAKKLGPKG
jgi:hypothetical protein